LTARYTGSVIGVFLPLAIIVISLIIHSVTFKQAEEARAAARDKKLKDEQKLREEIDKAILRAMIDEDARQRLEPSNYWIKEDDEEDDEPAP